MRHTGLEELFMASDIKEPALLVFTVKVLTLGGLTPLSLHFPCYTLDSEPHSQG